MVIMHNRNQPPPPQIDPYGKLIHLGIQIGKDLFERLNSYLDDYGVYAQCENILHWMLEHPLASVTLFTILFVCGLPIVLFAIFAVTSVMMTFTGFLLIEGTILSVASLFLLGIFVSIATAILFCGATVTSIYLAYCYIVKHI